MRSALALFLLPLAGCIAPAADPPSLGARSIEGVLDVPTRAIAPVASTPDADLAARIARLVREAEAGNADFAEALPGARRAIEAARGSASESEAWIVAQVELSALGGTRSPTTTALGALDEIFAEQAVTGKPSEAEALAAARDRVTALYREQSERYDALADQLRPR